ncbi:Rap/ran-GAP protein [Haplosporangium gracile]|nr:Rap/ran-GAP protein [Haplosporangium gracile]
MDNNGNSWTPIAAHEPLIEACTITFITTAATAPTTPIPPSAAVAEAITTITTTTTTMATSSSPSLHPLEQLPATNTYVHPKPSPSLSMSPTKTNDPSSFPSTTYSLPPLSTPLQTTTENSTLSLVNNTNTTTSLDASGTPASNTSFTTSNNNSSILHTDNNTNTASNAVTNNYTEPKTNSTNNNSNNNSSSSSSNISRHASSPSSSTTASDKSAKNVSSSVRNISTMTSGGKTLGFFGSLSPKSSKYKISNKKATTPIDSSRPPSSVPPSPHSNTIPPTTLFVPPLPSSHTPVSPAFAQSGEAATATSQRLQCADSSNTSSSSGKLPMDQTDSPRSSPLFHQQLPQHEPQQESPDSSRDKNDKKRAKDKDRHNSHFGQRLSKAIGFTSSSSKNQQQQRLRQLSVDSLSVIDAVPYPTSGTATAPDESPQQQQQQPEQAQRQTGKQTPEKEKEKKGGIMNHFLHRPRILSSNDGIKSKGTTQSSAGGATRVAGSMAALGRSQINSFKFPDGPFAQSAANSDVSLDSELHRDDSADTSRFAAGEDSDIAAMSRFQSRHRQDRGSSSNGKSLVDTLTARNFRRRPSLIVDLMPLPSMQQLDHQQPLPLSIADMVESAQELHPHYQPGDMERLSLYNHLGLQEIHYSTRTGEEPSEQMIRQLYGRASAPRKSHSTTLLLPGHAGYSSDTKKMGALEHHGLRRASSPGANLSSWNTSISPNTSSPAAISASPVTLSKSTSSRLGKLGRFKFPSLSMASIHRHKQSSLNGSSSSIQSTSDEQPHAMILANFNNKRRSSLSIPFKSSMFESTVTVPPPSPASHIHVSDSASTFASVNTVGMTTSRPSTVGSNSNHSSISSSYNVLDAVAAGGSMGGSKKPRQSLTAFLEDQAHHPHHSSTSGMNILPSTTSSAPPTQQQQSQIQRPLACISDAATGAQQQQQQQQHQPQQPHGHSQLQSRNLGNSFTGSEKFSANTTSATGTSSASSVSSGSGNSGSSQQHQGNSLGFRSGLLRRSSRRTVSASHISSKDIFATDPATTSHQEAAALAYQDLMESQVRGGPKGGDGSNGVEIKSLIRHFKSDRDIPAKALFHSLVTADTQGAHEGGNSNDGGEGIGDSGPDDMLSVESAESVVGQYLFGDELKNLSFGDRDTTLVKVDSIVDTTGAALFESGSRRKAVPANTVSDDVFVVAPVMIPVTLTTSSASTTMASANPDKALLSKLLSGKKKSDSYLPSAKDSTISNISTSATSISPTHLYTTDSKPTLGSIIIPRDRKLILGSKITLNSRQQETSTTPTPPTLIPRSPAAVAASRKFPGSPGNSSSSPPSYSTHPPILSPQMPASGIPTKSKFSILGTSVTPSSGFSYLQSRPSLNLTTLSSATPSKSHGVGSASISASSPYMPHHSSSTPLPGKCSNGFGSNGSSTPHLEPRSAVADYRPAIHYKRQRSMSLQDADLLTADQFIALMPDDAPTKRRFSSEETLPDNNSWAMSVKARNIPLPDPPTTLRSLHSTLKTKCDLVLKHLAAVSAPVPSALPMSPQQQQQQKQEQTQRHASTTPRHMASAATSASHVPFSTFSSSTFTLPTLSRPESESLSSSTTELTRRPVEEEEVPLTVSPSEQIFIRAHRTVDQQTSSTSREGGTDSRRVSVDETHSKRRGSEQSFVSSAVSGGIRLKSSLAVSGSSSGNGGGGQTAEATPTDRSCEFIHENSATVGVDQIDVVETVGMLFDEMDQIMTRMAEIFAKYISTDQFSNLLKESDEVCFQAQEAPERDVEGEAEIVHERKATVDQQVSSVHRQPQPQPQKLEFNKEVKTFNEPNAHRRDQLNPLYVQQNSFQQRSSKIAATTEPVATPATGSDTIGDVDGRQVKRKDSKDRIRHRRNQNHYKHQYRYQPQGRKPGEADANGEISSEEHQGAVYDYIRTVLATAETAMIEYMRTYNRMLVVPTNGYRIEGCNDLKKIERSLRSEHPHMPPLSITTPISGSPQQPSLMSRVSAVQNDTTDGPTPPEESTPQISASPPADCNSINPSGFTSSITTSDANQTPSPTMDIFSPSNASQGGQLMVRVKSFPEGKDEWAALQKRKETGDSPGVTGAISMGTPAPIGISVGTGAGIEGGIGRIGATGVAAGMVPGTGIAMMGEYSKEHMGHEAYYYRNWFLGKEHRTFVGQVEGLGTVIISIIKDMVVPTETRPQLPSRSSTGSNSLMQHSPFFTPASAGVGGSGSSSHSASLSRPELVHSAQSFYPGRGGGCQGNGVSGGGMMASPRTSSEAMRVILSASTAVTPGSGSSSNDNHGSGASGISGPHSGPGSANGSMGSSHLAPSISATPSPHSPNALQSNHHSGSNNNTNVSPRWQYRCILRQKDVDSIRITLPEPEPSPLNNLTRRAGKPQWKAILQSIHPAISQQVASKLKKVQSNQHFEMELAKFDETMLRFNYKFGVLLVHPGQTKEEDWFSNQMSSSPRFQEFLESGALGQKVALKGFERFSAGLDTRSEGGEYSYYDTWGEGFEIMYHVSTLLPYNTVDRQQIQRKRHIGNDIVCIVFVDGDQPFVPNAIKSQFLHIFVIIRLITLPDGTKGYSVTIACDEQVPEFGPPLPDPPIFKTSAELRAFLLCKMINGENAAYKAPRLIKPHQRARSGMLENLVTKANTLAKVKDIDKKLSKQQKAPAMSSSAPTAAQTLLSMSSSPNLTASHPIAGGATYNQTQSHCHTCYCNQYQQNSYQNGCYHCSYDKNGHSCCSAIPLASTSAASLGEEHTHPHHPPAHLINGRKGPIPAVTRTNSARNSLVVLGSETAATLFKSRRRSSNADSTKLDAQLHAGNMSAKEKGVVGAEEYLLRAQQQQQAPPDQFPGVHGYIETLLSPTVPGMTAPPSPILGSMSLSASDIGPFFQHRESLQSRPQADKSVPTIKSGISYHLHQQHHLQSALKQSSKSATSSPTESQFAMNRPGNNQAKSHSHYHTGALMNGLDAAMMNAETKDSNALGMSLTANSKGRSKSEVDLLLTPIHEIHNRSPNRHSTGLIMGSATANYPTSGTSGLNEFHHYHHNHTRIIATTPHSPHHHYHYQGSHQHSLLGVDGATPIQATTTTTATTGPVNHQAATAPAHFSMKGRAHNFLTTLVRRRASSNDTSGLGPTAHQISTPKHSHLGVTASSPLGHWINTAGSHHHHQYNAHGDQNLQHQHRQHCHHTHCCQSHRYQHHPSQQRHSLTSLSSNVAATAPVPTPIVQESSATIPIMGRPLKFKEGLNKGKTPIHINTAAAAALGSSHPNQYYQHSLHHSHNPPSASTASSASSSSFLHSSLPSASTLNKAGSTAFRSGSWGPAAGKAIVNNGSGELYSSTSTHMMLATPSSSSSTRFSPHSLRSSASRDAMHRSRCSLPHNQGFGRLTSEVSESLASAPASVSTGGVAGGIKQSKAEEMSSSTTTQVIDAVDGQQDEFQFIESPLPYTPQGQTPPIPGSKVMESRPSIDSLGSQLSSSTMTITTAPTAFPPGIGNLNKPSMDYMRFKPATSSTSSSSARDSLLQQQRYDPGLSTVGRARGQSADVRRGRRVDADPDDDDDECGNSSEDLARFLAMGPLALRESHSVMAMECTAESYRRHHHHHHYHHTRPHPQQQYFREDRRPISGSLFVRNESSPTFYHTSGAAITVAHHAPPSKPAISFTHTDVPPSLSRTSTSSSWKQVKRAVSVESFLGQKPVLSRVPSLRTKGYGLETASMSTMVASPPGVKESRAASCTSLLPRCCGGGNIALPVAGAVPTCGVILGEQEKHQIHESVSTAAMTTPDSIKAAGTGPATPVIVRTRQELTFVRKSSDTQCSCSHEVEDLDVKPIDT